MVKRGNSQLSKTQNDPGSDFKITMTNIFKNLGGKTYA